MQGIDNVSRSTLDQHRHWNSKNRNDFETDSEEIKMSEKLDSLRKKQYAYESKKTKKKRSQLRPVARLVDMWFSNRPHPLVEAFYSLGVIKAEKAPHPETIIEMDAPKNLKGKPPIYIM